MSNTVADTCDGTSRKAAPTRHTAPPLHLPADASAELALSTREKTPMTKSSIRLAAVAALTATGMLLAPASASAHSPNEQMMNKMRDHATMADVLGAHPELGGIKVADMDMPMGMDGGSMMARMRGHGTMADVLDAHPELGGMKVADMDMPMGMDGGSMMAKMRGHATMADVLRAHPELGDMTMADMDMGG